MAVVDLVEAHCKVGLAGGPVGRVIYFTGKDPVRESGDAGEEVAGRPAVRSLEVAVLGASVVGCGGDLSYGYASMSLAPVRAGTHHAPVTG